MSKRSNWDLKGRRHSKDSIEEWLDEQSESKTGRKRKSPEKEASWLPWAAGNALVAEVFPKLCRVIRQDGVSGELLCGYKRTSVFQSHAHGGRARSPVCVGDRVQVEIVGKTDGIVKGVCERQNSLTRQAPGRDGSLYHEIAANIDLLVIVASAEEPAFSPGLVDRFLIAALAQKIPVLIAINKIDLNPSDESRAWDVYRDLGYDCLEISAKREMGIHALQEKVQGKTTVFCGHSGVGKTSLLGSLAGRNVGKTGEVNTITGKGKHTTTSAVLLEAGEGTRWIDTPGVRAFVPMGIGARDLLQFFPELNAEPDENRRKLLPRFESYLRILESLEAK